MNRQMMKSTDEPQRSQILYEIRLFNDNNNVGCLNKQKGCHTCISRLIGQVHSLKRKKNTTVNNIIKNVTKLKVKDVTFKCEYF